VQGVFVHYSIDVCQMMQHVSDCNRLLLEIIGKTGILKVTVDGVIALKQRTLHSLES